MCGSKEAEGCPPLLPGVSIPRGPYDTVSDVPFPIRPPGGGERGAAALILCDFLFQRAFLCYRVNSLISLPCEMRASPW